MASARLTDADFLAAAQRWGFEHDDNDEDVDDKLAALFKQMYINGERAAFAAKDEPCPSPTAPGSTATT